MSDQMDKDRLQAKTIQVKMIAFWREKQSFLPPRVSKAPSKYFDQIRLEFTNVNQFFESP